MKNYRAIGLSVFISLLVGCESRVQSVAEQKTQITAPTTHTSASKQYLKPGADVALVDTSPIKLVPGQTSSVDIDLAVAKNVGELKVDIRADDGLEILSQPKQLEFKLVPYGRYKLPLQLLAQTPGRFYIHIQAQLTQSGQTLGRSLTVAVHVGEPIQQQKMAHSSSAANDAVISLPAQETIITLPTEK